MSSEALFNTLKPAGNFWNSRASTPDLFRAMGGLAVTGELRSLESIVGQSLPGGLDAWKIRDEQHRFVRQWLNPVMADVTGDIEMPFVFKHGTTGLVIPGMTAQPVPEGVLVDGLRLKDISYEGVPQTGSYFAKEFMLVPAKLVPFHEGTEFASVEVGGEEFLWVYQGQPISVRTFLFEIIRHDTWFVRCPRNKRPVSLLTARGPLYRNTGFIQVGNWIGVFEDPAELWPAGFVVAPCSQTNRPSFRSSALRADQFIGSGNHVAKYLRTDQGPRQFERALAELAGETILDEDQKVTRVTRIPGGFRYWTDRSHMDLAGPALYQVGQTIPMGRGHRIKVLCHWLDGDFWNRLRLTTSSRFFWPDLPAVNLDLLPRSLVADETKAWFLLGQDQEEQIWSKIGPDLKTAAGLEAGQTMMISPLDFFVSLLKERLLWIQTDLPTVAPGTWHLVRAWAERERPAGSVLVA